MTACLEKQKAKQTEWALVQEGPTKPHSSLRALMWEGSKSPTPPEDLQAVVTEGERVVYLLSQLCSYCVVWWVCLFFLSESRMWCHLG